MKLCALLKKIAVFTIIQCSLFIAPPVLAATYYVDKNHQAASDNNSGDESHPFKTVQKGIESATSGDSVYIKPEMYDLSGFSKYIENGLSLIGADRDATVLKNGGALQFSSFLKVVNLTFKDYDKVLFYIRTSSEQSISSISIQDCTFENVRYAVYTSSETEGKISNVNISHCDFVDINRPEVAVLFLGYGLVSSVRIENNRFRNLTSSDGGCSAIIVGSNATRDTTRDVTIKANHMDWITGLQGNETHGILAYGTNIRIEDNVIRNLNAGQDHEAIYMKASYSEIKNNRIEACGSGAGGADICAKGGKQCVGNTISRNTITSEKTGRGIMANGEATITLNYIRKTNGLNGIDVYAYGKRVTIQDNSVEVNGKGIYVHDAVGGGVTGNFVISHENLPITMHNVSRVNISDNEECQGHNCGEPPFRTEPLVPAQE